MAHSTKRHVTPCIERRAPPQFGGTACRRSTLFCNADLVVGSPAAASAPVVPLGPGVYASGLSFASRCCGSPAIATGQRRTALAGRREDDLRSGGHDSGFQLLECILIVLADGKRVTTSELLAPSLPETEPLPRFAECPGGRGRAYILLVCSHLRREGTSGLRRPQRRHSTYNGPLEARVNRWSRPWPCLGLSSTGSQRDFAVPRFGWFALPVALVAASVVLGADALAPSEIQATFFTGQAFTARTPSGLKFKMTFTPDGKMTREPLAPVTKGPAQKSVERGSPSIGTGTWRLNAKGFCTTWAHSKPTCFTVVPSGDNKWSVQRIATTIATTVSVWSK